MRGIEFDVPVYIFTGPTDMRKGFDSLAELVRMELRRGSTPGGLFGFFSRRRDRTRTICWNDDGYALLYKRLKTGVFRVEEGDGYELPTGVGLKMLLYGMDLTRIKLRRAPAQVCIQNLLRDRNSLWKETNSQHTKVFRGACFLRKLSVLKKIFKAFSFT